MEGVTGLSNTEPWRDEMDTLGDALPREIARVRDEVLPLYTALGVQGAFGAAMIRLDLDDASKAMIEGDLPAMLRAYHKLKETEG
jgi:hypothetical protein